ncbi:putative RING-H2 finger protein ATL50 [Oryza sativa Japonica Group]|uniref:putative RING-H2 finger protein ATL50 n=1 Tax=Oryza sativa subsp. japonica TaxID=39947 RepID=UPI0002249DA5
MVPPAPGAAAAGEGLPGRWMMRTLDAGGRRGGAQQRWRRCSCLRRPATARAAPSCRRTPNASIYCFIHRRHQHQHQHQLDEVAIESIALTRYHDGACMLGATDCPVCLGEFRDGELLRLLPKCGRAFYVPALTPGSAPLAAADSAGGLGDSQLPLDLTEKVTETTEIVMEWHGSNFRRL